MKEAELLPFEVDIESKRDSKTVHARTFDIAVTNCEDDDKLTGVEEQLPEEKAEIEEEPNKESQN